MRSLAAALLAALALPAVAEAAPSPAVDRALDAVERAGLPRDRAEVVAVRRTPAGLHVRGVEARGGVPVDATGWVVTSRGGRIADVALDRSSLPGAPAARPAEREAAVRLATATLGATPYRVKARRLLVARGGRLADTWRVTVLSLRPAVAASVDVDARTGRVTDVLHEERHIDVVGRLFDPNPIVTSRNAALRQPFEQGLPADPDLDSPELTAARRDLPMRGLDEQALTTGRLSGPWVNVLGMAGYNAFVNRSLLDLTRGDPRFEGAMAYAHVDRLQREFQRLGFTGTGGVNAEPQEVVATRVEGFDNSFYQPANDLMLLGTGGVDDGEDAEVIVHEYGHAVHDAQVPGWGATSEGGAMGEGFGDWLAATHYAPGSAGFQDACIMDWDATSYSSASPPCLRRADTAKRYPKDAGKGVHADGELWSAFLWRVRAALGRTEHELLTPQATFAHAVAALRKAAPLLGHPEWVAVVEREAAVTGFPLAPKAG